MARRDAPGVSSGKNPPSPDGSGAANAPNDLYLLFPLRREAWPANRVSCDQDIAGDGFFSLGMIARLESCSLSAASGSTGVSSGMRPHRTGPVSGGRSGRGARGTGIGCFYDDGVHELVGLSGDKWQSLYHLPMGIPVDDPRLTTEPGYRGRAV